MFTTPSPEGTVVTTGWHVFFSSRRRHTRLQGDWSSDVCSSDLAYNDWLYNAYTKRDGRLQGIALLPILDVGAAVTELRHAVRDLGVRGALLPAATVLGDRKSVV